MNESQGELQTDTSALYSSTFAQVIFVNVEKLYMTDIPVKCNYTLTPLINAHKKDWIGIFKVGWSTARDYHTFVWAPLPKEDSQVERQQQVTFEAYYLPKDNNDFYQFCYVTHKGEIRGASTPFGFRLANSSMSEHMDSDSSQEMLIITTQDKLEESEREKDELTGNNLRLMEENTSLKKTIEELETQAEQDKEGHSGALEMNKKDVMALEKQMSEQKVDTEMKMRARSEKTEQLRTELTEKEAACLNAQKENQDLRAKMESAWASVGQSKQKYEQAADKMKQLQQETETLKMEIGTKETELTSLSGTKKQIASELRMVQDNLKLVQFDFDSQKKENEKLKEHLKKMTEVEVLLQNQTAEICHLRHGLSDYEKLKVSNSNTGQLQEQLENLRQHLKGTEGQLQLAKQWQIQTAAERRAAEADREKSDANLHDAHQDIQNWKSKFQKIDQILSKREFDFDTQKKENEKLKEHLKKMTEVEVLLKNQTAEICHLRRGLSDYEKLKASNSNTGQLQEQVENLRQHLKGTEEQLQLAKQRQIQTAVELRAAEADREKSDANLHDAHQDIQHWKSKFQKIDQILSKREGCTEGGGTADHPLQKEIASLKAKLLTGKSCYVQKYKECQRLHKQIDKLKVLLEDKNKCHSPIKEIVEITENAETAASSGGLSVQQPRTQLAEITTNLGDRAEKAMVAFTEIERELEDKTHIVDIRTLEVADLQEQIRKLNKMIDELRVGPSHQSGAFQLEHPNPYSLTVPKVHSGQAGLLFGNPYSQCSVKGSQTVTSIDFVQNLDGQENSQDADEEHIDSQKCPVCEVLFPLNLEDFDFEQHVLKHFVYECPVCQSTFPENRQAAYEDHVESHFSEVN